MLLCSHDISCTVFFDALISTANSSACNTAKSITVTIPASFSFLAAVGPRPEFLEFLDLILYEISLYYRP